MRFVCSDVVRCFVGCAHALTGRRRTLVATVLWGRRTVFCNRLLQGRAVCIPTEDRGNESRMSMGTRNTFDDIRCRLNDNDPEADAKV